MTDSQQPTRGLMRRVVIRGGPGSGHFGHEGRPGQVGGSAPGDFHSAEPTITGTDANVDAEFLAASTGIRPTRRWKWDEAAQEEILAGIREWATPVENIPEEWDKHEMFVAPTGELFSADGIGHEQFGLKALVSWVREMQGRGVVASDTEITGGLHHSGEDTLLALGWVRISRGGAGGKNIGISWSASAGLTEKQKSFLRKLGKHTIGAGGNAVYEFDGGQVSHVFGRWPSNAFASALDGDFDLMEEEKLEFRSLDDVPEWAKALLIHRGGPGSGHFGHEGRPGKVGGSQPGDFHSAEPGPESKAIDQAAMERLMPGIPVTAEDAKWLEEWYAKAAPIVDPLTNEVLVSPSGQAYDVRGLGGHEGAGEQALRSLGVLKLPNKASSVIVEPPQRGFAMEIERWAEGVGPEGDGWDRNLDGTLTFTFLSMDPMGDMKPVKYAIRKVGDAETYNVQAISNWDGKRPSILTNYINSALEISGRDPWTEFESEEKAKQYVEGLLFGKAETLRFSVSVPGNETRSYNFVRMPPETLDALGLDPKKNIVPEYNWHDERTPPILVETVDEAAGKLRDYVASRKTYEMEGGGVQLTTNRGVSAEEGILSMGFMRISRDSLTQERPVVGISWNQAVGLTDAQRRVAVRVAKDTVERGGELAWERYAGFNAQEQRWNLPRVSGMVTQLPDSRFTAGIQGKEIEFVARSSEDLPAWALRVLIQRGGPGSGHFGHAGRPGEVGGSAPGDFHSSPVDYPEWVDSDEMKKKVAEGLGMAVAKWVTHGNVVGRGNASSNFSGRGWMAHDGTLYLAPTEHLTLANMALRSATSGTPKDWGNAEMVLKRMGFGRMVITSDEFYYNGPDKVTPEQGETINALLATRRESVFAETPNHAGATRPGKEGDDREYLDKMVDAAYRLVGRSRPLVERGGTGSGHFKHEGRQGARGGSEPGDRLPKDRGEQMKQAKQDFHSATPTKREPVGAVASHIGPGYRMNMTADAFSKYRPAVSAALEWAAREFKQTLGGQVEGVTIHDDPVAFIEANNPEMYAESMAKLDEEGKREVEAGLRQDFGKSLASYNPETKQMLVNVGKHIKPDGALDTDSVMESATHEFVHWATFGSGRDEIWKEVKVPQGFKDIFWGPYGKDLIQQEYVARVVSSEMRGSDTLTLPGDIVTLAMTDEDHKNARLLMDKISNAFVAPNLEMPTTLRVSPERLVDVTVPDGLGNFWGRAVPESKLDSLPAGSTVNAIYAMLKGEEAFEEGRTIRPDVLSLNWLDETDPARHPVRQQITKKPRLDDVTVAIRSQDNVLERVLDTIGGALRELMGMKHG